MQVSVDIRTKTIVTLHCIIFVCIKEKVWNKQM